MSLKTYQAQTMAQALADVKKDLGRDAVILRTRTVRKGRFLGLFGGRRLWEVVASPNDVPQSKQAGRYVSASRGADSELSGLAAEAAPAAGDRRAAPPADSAINGSLAQEVAHIRQMVQALLEGRAVAGSEALPAELQHIHKRLLEQEVASNLADELVRQLRQQLAAGPCGQGVEEVLTALTASRIPVVPCAEADTGRARVVALIGPTGVGKTTTIAKLAANYKLRERKRVGLITIDTYRIAAVDQLRTYADIIEVPLQAVLTAGELVEAVDSMRDLDVILIDTAGRSQNDRLRLNQLRSFLAAANADEVHLVLSASAGFRSNARVLAQFGPLGANRIILTKLDEAETFGMILNLAAEGAAAISYVTTGQDVPDDIEPADAVRLARRIIGGCEHGH